MIIYIPLAMTQWDLIFNFAIFIPTVVIVIIRILQWKNKL
jgi:hypothetical protein